MIGLSSIIGICGAELLPCATMPDGTPAPIVCTLCPHADAVWHENLELGTQWEDR